MEALSTMIFTEQSFFQSLVGKYVMPVWHFGEVLNRACEEFVLRNDVLEQLKAEKFDVYMGEQLISCGTLYSHLLGIKTHVWIS
ncbi:CRE-UGT-48 protein, partial [Aphelenchoides avenae]